jgi:CBS domain-containing protein
MHPAIQARVDETFTSDVHITSILERLRREPALQGWVLMAPTRTLAMLGVNLDDDQLVQLLEQIEAMDQRPVPVTARDVMTTEVITIAMDSSTHEAERVLADNRISGLPVLGPDGNIVGVLSVYDLLAKSGATVRDIMSRDVTTVLDTAPISNVRAVLVSQRLRRVPVIDAEGHLVGIISLGDLVRELAYRSPG